MVLLDKCSPRGDADEQDVVSATDDPIHLMFAWGCRLPTYSFRNPSNDASDALLMGFSKAHWCPQTNEASPSRGGRRERLRDFRGSRLGCNLVGLHQVLSLRPRPRDPGDPAKRVSPPDLRGWELHNSPPDQWFVLRERLHVRL